MKDLKEKLINEDTSYSVEFNSIAEFEYVMTGLQYVFNEELPLKSEIKDVKSIYKKIWQAASKFDKEHFSDSCFGKGNITNCH